MDLSVIILNYNVRYLLESCIESVISAVVGLDAEIIIVDNASTDDSTDMVQSKYAFVKLIKNNINLGFSKGNNIGVDHALGKYILILNPDTIINENAIRSGLQYLIDHQDTGAVGVKMINENGTYLKESKRGFPDLPSSLFKLSGLNRIFPKSKWINHYYLGHLSIEGIHEVESLTGAFMMMPKELYLSLNGFDEDFFMYGEDIDLSSRIREAGKKIIYLGNEQITHLKGRSANEYSFEHVNSFYSAMAVFIQKYQLNPVLKLIELLGIRMASVSSWVKRQIVNKFLFISDLITILIILGVVQQVWATVWFRDPTYFHHNVFLMNAGSYAFIWMMSLFIFNAYQPLNQHRTQNTFQAVWSGTVVIILIYALLPDYWRSSRAVLVISGLIISIFLPGWRQFLSPQGNGYRALFIGSERNEAEHNSLFKELAYHDFFSYISRFVWTGELKNERLNQLLKSQKISHLLLDHQSIRNDEILELASILPNYVSMLYIKDKNDHSIIDFSIPGLISADVRLYRPSSMVIKRMINSMACIFILPWGWIRKDIRSNFFLLLSERKYFVGYQVPIVPFLPKLKPGIWSPSSNLVIDNTNSADLNFNYARHYTITTDIKIILFHLFTFN